MEIVRKLESVEILIIRQRVPIHFVNCYSLPSYASCLSLQGVSNELTKKLIICYYVELEQRQ
jgi:hypothetical protein